MRRWLKINRSTQSHCAAGTVLGSGTAAYERIGSKMLIFLLSMKRLATSLTHSFIHSFIQPVPTERVPDTVLGGHKDLTVITKVSALEALSATATSLTHTHAHTWTPTEPPGSPATLGTEQGDQPQLRVASPRSDVPW